MATVKTINLNKFVKEFGPPGFESGKLLKNQKKLIIDSVYEGCLKSVKTMAERSPVDTGLYASAWLVKKEGKKAVYFGNTAPYAIIIEKGAEPFDAPIQPLIEWSARQLQTTPDDPEARRLAWGVKRKLAREGMEPKHILEKGLEEVIIPMIKDMIEKNARKPDANKSF